MVTRRHLLDANVLIALTVQEHEHHDRVSRWMRDVEGFALTPVVEGALVRYLLRLGESPRTALRLLVAVQGLAGAAFWRDDLSYADVDLGHVQGHRQVTDAYLASVVRARPPARLATLDEGLALAAPDVVDLVP